MSVEPLHCVRINAGSALLCFVVAFFFALPSASHAESFTPTVEGKKLIGSGIWNRSSSFVRENVGHLEQLPFDGVIIGRFYPFWAGKQDGTKIPVDTAPPFDKVMESPEEDLDSFAANLKATKFNRFTDNFIGLECCNEGDFDWLSDARCEELVKKWGLLAAAAKQAGLKGIQFDTECYHGVEPFLYHKLNAKRPAAMGEYAARLNHVGALVMKEVNKHFPDMVLLVYWGHTSGFHEHFLDGMLSEAQPGFVMVDGFEQAYGFRHPQQFADGRATIQKHPEPRPPTARRPATPESKFIGAYRKHVRVGFPVWPCHWHGQPPRKRSFNAEDFTQNYYTPDELAYATQCALSYSDKYVWVWNESLNFWQGTLRVYDPQGNVEIKPIPQEYVQALARGRQGNVPPPPKRDYAKVDTTPK